MKQNKVEELCKDKNCPQEKCHCDEMCDCNGNDCHCDEACDCNGNDCHCQDKSNENELTSDEIASPVEEVTKDKELINKLEEENKALVGKVKLAQAELINYRKRKDEETANLLKYANQGLIMELITLVDNFERAIKLDDNDLTDELSKFLAGFKMMYSSLMDTLKKFGVEEINRAGEVFDPTQEQALLTDHVEGMQDDVVIEVLLKGYKLKDRVIRPASVKINQN